jgi:hypothetical protein
MGEVPDEGQIEVIVDFRVRVGDQQVPAEASQQLRETA